MNQQEKKLWSKIQQFSLDDEASVFPFSRRLMRENGWDSRYALRVIEEYKKFMFLLCVCPHPVTPSDQIDQVWHLHLLYTQNYWEDFCENVLERKVHHGPTKGGNQEREKYTNLYELTQKAYKDYFQTAPPNDIWWDGEKRFKEIHFQRVNLDRNWVIPKPNPTVFKWTYLLSGMVIALGCIWSCTIPQKSDEATMEMFYVVGLISFFVIVFLWIIFYDDSKSKKKPIKSNAKPKSKSKKKQKKSSSSSNSSTVASDGSVSGCSTVSDSSADSGDSSFGGGDSGGGGGDSSGCSGCGGCGGGCGGGD